MAGQGFGKLNLNNEQFQLSTLHAPLKWQKCHEPDKVHPKSLVFFPIRWRIGLDSNYLNLNQSNKATARLEKSHYFHPNLPLIEES